MFLVEKEMKNVKPLHSPICLYGVFEPIDYGSGPSLCSFFLGVVIELVHHGFLKF